MFNQTRLFPVLAGVILLLMVAAQCGVQPEQRAQSAAAPQAQAKEAQHEAETHSPEADLATPLEELAAISLGEGEKLKVVATTTIVGDIVSQVGGDLIELKVLLPLGIDTHGYSPTPQDVAAVADAQVVFINGFGLEGFLQELIQNAGGEAVVISLSEGIEPREFAEGEDHEHEETEEEPEESEAGHQHEGVDPHTFMTAANAMIFVHNSEQALSALDPANAVAYKAKAEAYEAQLAILESWIQEQLATIPPKNRRMVTDHEAFGYYAGHYGLEVVGAIIPAYSTSAEPSAQELSQLQDVIAEYGVKAVFVGTTTNPAMAQQVAEDTGLQLVSLYSESLGEPGSGAETYLDYMRYNTTAIVEALK